MYVMCTSYKYFVNNILTNPFHFIYCQIDMYSKECQAANWKKHKATCARISKDCKEWNENMTRELPDSNIADDMKEGPCAICLDETITNPINLPCGHVFCFECVGQYQLATKKKEVSIEETDEGHVVTAFVPFNTNDDGSLCFSTKEDESLCPYCRGEIPNVLKTTIERGKIYSKRALSLPKGSEEQSKYAKLAVAEFDSVLDVVGDRELTDEERVNNLVARAAVLEMTGEVRKPCSDIEFRLTMLYEKGEMMALLLTDPKAMIKMATEIVSLSELYYAILTPTEVYRAKRWKAQAYSTLGEWNKAMDIYLALMKGDVEAKGINIVTVLGCMRSCYEKAHSGLYDSRGFDLAIECGEIPYMMGARHWSGVHKYAALSHIAKGNIVEARKTIMRAILYEEHWNKDNLEENKRVLRMILAYDGTVVENCNQKSGTKKRGGKKKRKGKEKK